MYIVLILNLLVFGPQTDGFQNSRCLNTNCPAGFQPEAGAAITLGDVIEPVSQPNGIKQTLNLKVIKVVTKSLALDTIII
jgi:hypothetical protein